MLKTAMIKIVYRVIGTRENREFLCERDSGSAKISHVYDTFVKLEKEKER